MDQTIDNKRKVQCLCVGNIQTNCWIYLLPDSGAASDRDAPQPCAVIDPGDEAPVIIDHLRKNNLSPKYILLTHGHFDHVTALPDLVKAFSVGQEPDLAHVAIHRDDASYLKPGPVMFLSDGDTVGPFKVIHLPGHTPGSIAFYDEENEILFTGDTLFCGDRGRTDLPGGDQAKIEKSLEQLLSMKGSIRVFPGHGPKTTIAQEAARGLAYFM